MNNLQLNIEPGFVNKMAAYLEENEVIRSYSRNSENLDQLVPTKESKGQLYDRIENAINRKDPLTVRQLSLEMTESWLKQYKKLCKR